MLPKAQIAPKEVRVARVAEKRTARRKRWASHFLALVHRCLIWA